MIKIPNFLPEILKLKGSWDEIIKLLYSIFEKDFKITKTRHCGLNIIYDSRILKDGDGKEEGFWHVISKFDSQTNERLIDYRRAERLPWAKPIMESEKCEELIIFDYDHGNARKGIRRYIWLKNHDYVIVLRNKVKFFFWITAFYIDKSGTRKDLHRRYLNSV